MDLSELEKIMEDIGKNILTFENINKFRSLNGLSHLTNKEKLNLCAQEKYSNRIQKIYISLGRSWIIGFIRVKEDTIEVDNIYSN